MTTITYPSIRLVLAIIASTLLGVLWILGLSHDNGTTPDQGGAPQSSPGQHSSPGAQNTPETPEATESTPTPANPEDVPTTGSGQFTTVSGSRHLIGYNGHLIRYQVVVEQSTLVDLISDPDEFASTVQETLADPRGWTARGEWLFQQTVSGPADVVVHLATPTTTDDICGSHGLRTRGEVSCRGGDDVVINLKRWMLGVPWYSDSLVDYRRMVINHEIGHFLGHGHESCPAPGVLAPVMQPQTNDLEGCLRNPWPYPSG